MFCAFCIERKINMEKTKIDWLDEVLVRKTELLEILEKLLRIPSVRNEMNANSNCPVGIELRRALVEMMKIGQEAGFTPRDFGPLVGRLDWGADDLEPFAILGHVDVVPVGDDWKTDPFVPTYKDGKLYARGSLDDKGPLVCAFFAMKLLKELGFTPKKQVQMIIGTDEESDWKCLTSYQKQATLPEQGFVPDAYFPIVNGEKGVAHLIFHYEAEQVIAKYQLLQFTAGLKENMVPALAQAILVGDKITKLAIDYEIYLDQQGLLGECSIEGNQLHLTLHGKSTHGSSPQNGINAATYLAAFLKHYDFGSRQVSSFLYTAGDLLHLSHNGMKLGIANHDEQMGDLTINLGLANFNLQHGGKLVIDIRYPKSITPNEMTKAILQVGAESQQFEVIEQKPPHYVPGSSPLVKKLLDIYEEQTGQKGSERVIGGATYARLLKEGVAFGALFPTTQDTMHQADEHIPVADLLKATAIYAQAIAELACM